MRAWPGSRPFELPITLSDRKGSSKLRTFRDGWRSLRMMLLYCPNKVFLWPGVALCLVGSLVHAAQLIGLVSWDGRSAAGVTGVFATIFTVVGVQVVSLGLHAKTYSWSRRFDKDNAALEWLYDHFKLEAGLALGVGLVFLGAAILASVVGQWLRADMLPLPNPQWASLAATLILVGCSTLFFSLFISAMSVDSPRGIRR